MPAADAQAVSRFVFWTICEFCAEFALPFDLMIGAVRGVSVQTGVIMLDYINQLRARGQSIQQAAVEGSILRLRPIMMTMLVATLGLLPAAMSHAIGSDSQRPFAIVIVGGLIATLGMSIFLLPTLYVWIARPGDVRPDGARRWAPC